MATTTKRTTASDKKKEPCTLVTVRLQWTELSKDRNEFECTFSTKESQKEVGQCALAAAKSALGAAAKKAITGTGGGGGGRRVVDQLVLEVSESPDGGGGGGGKHPPISSLAAGIVKKEAASAKRERRPPSRKVKDQSGVAHRVVLRAPWNEGELRRMVAERSHTKRCRDWIQHAERKLWIEVVANPGDWQYQEASNSFRHRTDELAEEVVCHGEVAMPLVDKACFAVSVDGFVALRARKAVKEEEERRRKKEEEEEEEKRRK